MDQLPNELLYKILIEIPVEQILILKQVNKKWYSLIHNSIKLKNLLIKSKDSYLLLTKLFNDFDEYSYDYQFEIEDRVNEFIVFKPDQPIFTQLRKLCILNRSFAIASINSLTFLEVLEIYDSKIKKGKIEIELNLPNLRVFCLENNSISDFMNLGPLILNCPKLVKLKHLDFCGLEIKHPQSVKEFFCYFSNFSIKGFVNLEYLYYDYVKCEEEVLSNLKNLKEIHLNKNLETFNQLQSYKRWSNRKNLKIYFLGLDSDYFNFNVYNEIPYPEKYSCGESIDEATINLYRSNWSNLPKKFFFLNTVNYTVLENHLWNLPNQPIRSIIKKIFDLKKLILTSEVRDLDQFKSILKDRRYLKALIITADYMDQNFFDNILSENCKAIQSLTIRNKNQLNFDFLIKFSDLCYFETNLKLKIETVYKMVDKFRYLTSLAFFYEGSSVTIKKNFEHKKSILLIDEIRYVFDDFRELLEFVMDKAKSSADETFVKGEDYTNCIFDIFDQI